MTNLKDLFERHFNETFLIYGTENMVQRESFSAFFIRFAELAGELRHAGILEGTVVGFQPDNSPEHVAFLFALWSLNLTPALFSRRLPSHRLKEMLPDGLIFTREQVLELARQAHRRSGKSLQESVGLPLDRKVIFWTSGSSSRPKAAVLSLKNFYFNALGSNENISFSPGDQWLLKLPLEHVGGMSVLFRALLGGGAVVLNPELTEVLPDVTHLSFVSTQLYRFLSGSPQEIAGLRESHFKAVLLGGGAFPKDLIERGLKQGLPLFKSYGMTEMASQITTTKPGASKEELATASGWRLKEREIKIEEGVVFVKGPCLFEGYWDGVKTQAPLDQDGWFRTRDLGSWTPQGLQILGRADRMFICAGENIQPEFIEQTLLEYPGVSVARVVPRDDQEYGKLPVAYVQWRDSGAEGELRNFLKERLTGLQIPREILSWSALPDEFKTAKDL